MIEMHAKVRPIASMQRESQCHNQHSILISFFIMVSSAKAIYSSSTIYIYIYIYIYALERCVWNICNIQIKHLQLATWKHLLQHKTETTETIETYSCNMCETYATSKLKTLKTDETFWTNACNMPLKHLQHIQHPDLFLQHLHGTLATYLRNIQNT
jgi:hypothetical protein